MAKKILEFFPDFDISQINALRRFKEKKEQIDIREQLGRLAGWLVADKPG